MKLRQARKWAMQVRNRSTKQLKVEGKKRSRMSDGDIISMVLYISWLRKRNPHPMFFSPCFTRLRKWLMNDKSIKEYASKYNDIMDKNTEKQSAE